MRRCRSWFDSMGRMPKRGVASWKRRRTHGSSRLPRCWTRPRRRWRWLGRRRARPDMAVLLDEATKVLVQGITGREGTFHTLRNRAYGTKVVAGVTPGKSGHDVEGIPVFDTVADAVREQGANVSMIFVPPRFAAEAILEAADAGVRLVVCI